MSILRQKVITAFKLSYSMLEVDADLLDAIYDHVGLASEEERKREMAKLLCLYIDILEHGGEPLYFSDFMLVLAPDKLGIEYIDRGEEDFKNGFSESEKSCLGARTRIPLDTERINLKNAFFMPFCLKVPQKSTFSTPHAKSSRILPSPRSPYRINFPRTPREINLGLKREVT